MKFIRPNAITDAGGTFTRAAGTATYFNSNGVLVLGSTNVPRENYVYDETTSQWRSDGVLIEPSKTNYILYSDDFSDAEWGKSECTITPNGVTGPTGTATGDLLIPSTNNTQHFISQAETLADGVYTISVFVKIGGGYDKGQFYMNNDTSSIGLTFDLAENTSVLFGNTTEWAAPSIGMQRWGVSWFRLFVTATKTIGTTITWRLLVQNSLGNSTFAGNGTSSIGVYGGQLEQGSLTTYIPTTTATVTRPADTVTGTGMIYSSIAETDHAAWNAGTAYIIGDRVIRTTTTTHKIYERVVAGTTATAPESDAINWIEVSPTNRWKLFDESPSTITTSASETMSYILKPGRSNSFAALEVDATEIAINVYISGERVYSGYTNMLNNENVGNWYEYFYEPFYYQTSLAITDLLNAANLELPASTDMIITVTLRKAGSTPSIGALVTGIVYELGMTQNGMSLSIIDYSRKETNDYGNTILVRRKFSKRLQATFFLYSSKVDVVSNLLTQYRATPVVWIGADNQYNSLVIYGFYRDWNIGIPNNIGSTCNIEIEGLA